MQQAAIMPQPIQSEKPNSFMGMALLSALIATSMAFFLFWQNQQLRIKLQQAQVSPTPSPSASASPSPADPTADWQTYTNNEIGFTFKYPSKWSKNNEQNPSTVLIDLVTENNQRFFVTYNMSYSIQEWLDDTQSGKIIGKQSIDQYTFTIIEGGTALKSHELAIEVKGNGILRFVIEPSKSLDDSKNIFDQILSTFKFTNSGSNTSFKKYTGKFFSFNYPSDMTYTEKETQDPDNAANKGVSVVFKNAKNQIIVSTDFVGGWGADPCMKHETRTVAGYSASVSLFRMNEFGAGKCGEGYVNILTLINDQDFNHPFPIYFEYRTLNDDVLNMDVFNSLLNGLQINKT